MKQVELTVLTRDVDRVIEFLGRHRLIQFSQEDHPGQKEESRSQDGKGQHIQENLEKIQTASAYLGIELPAEPEETGVLPGDTEKALTEKITAAVAQVSLREDTEREEKKKIELTLNESRAFSNLNAPFKELDHISYLTLRLGRLDPRGQAEMKKSLTDRAVIIPLDGERVLAAASRRGRFALDSELKKRAFAPITIPEGFRGIPNEVLAGLESRVKELDQGLEEISRRKVQLRDDYGPKLRQLAACYLMASVVEKLKEKLVATKSVFFLSGWVQAESVTKLVKELSKITEGRVGIRTFNPYEVDRVKRGKEKVPVSLKHGAFVKGFERVVFSYGAPLYGTIDPTPFVAFFFVILFGIMFGDLGQGFVLLLLGILSSERGIKSLTKFRLYAIPLIAVGIASMIMGLLTGSVFANEELLVEPTRHILGLFMSEPPDRILHLMPEGDSIEKLFYFFGFTVGIGILFNSIGLWINIINQITLKNYEKAFFSKTGIAGVLIFWYALFIAVRGILGGRFACFDLLGILIPGFCIFFGPVMWRIIAGKRPILEEGLMVFIMEGFVEILETLSTYISNTVSFLRVGAFGLSHAVLSFIVFTLSGMVSHLPVGPLFSLIIMIFGNGVIILLEGMIVAIQVVRLQYYEFFSKFFSETGVEFVPFRFRGKVAADHVRGQSSKTMSENSN
jgi:V/A-type H+-transporting ATPase subunit I